MNKHFILLFKLNIILLFSSCMSVFETTKQKNKNSNIQIFTTNRDSFLVIKSISVINRIKDDYTKISDLGSARVDDSTNNFTEIMMSINNLSKSNFLVKFKNSDFILNDSIYKPLLKTNEFKNGFSYTQMQAIDFKEKENGIYIVVTVAKSFRGSLGWSGSPTGYSIHLIYDFFNIEKGKVTKAVTIIHFRPTNNKSKWQPNAKDTKEVFEKLYKIKAN